jgi:hypothetical protein
MRVSAAGRSRPFDTRMDDLAALRPFTVETIVDPSRSASLFHRAGVSW